MFFRGCRYKAESDRVVYLCMAITYDAIVIGSGISGGWAAKELCEKGLKTLLLERGPDVKHLKDYPTATMHPWEFPHRNQLTKKFIEDNPVASKCYALKESSAHFFVKDNEHPYTQEKPFDWIRGYQVGGKSLLWARQTQRWSRFDFEGPARDGFAVDWPIRYDDIAPWYSHVEKFTGISGNKDGLETLPDGEFLPPWEMNCAEKSIAAAIQKNYQDRFPVIGRCAHLTQPQPIHFEQGRGKCQARTLCERGCPFGGYFSSNAATLPWAAKTGKLELLPNSVVQAVLYDETKQKASGVLVVDTITKEQREYKAAIIFVTAATLNTNLILLNSTSKRFPNGLGNDNGLLGTHIAFHNYRGQLTGTIPGMEADYYQGRRPCAVMMPNFRNVRKQEMDFQRGYMSFFSAYRPGFARGADGIGAEMAANVAEPGNWQVFMMMQGETIPKQSNRVQLDPIEKDAWGIPRLSISVDYDENDEKILADFLQQGQEMLEKAGVQSITTIDTKQAPGLDIHEMGGVRMGHDPADSLLNKWNQMHACKNVFVTDGACMTSTGTQNPSLTFMALTARAANYAVEELKKMNL